MKYKLKTGYLILFLIIRNKYKSFWVYWIVRKGKSKLHFIERLANESPSSPGSIVHSNGGGRIREPPLTLCRPKTSRNRQPPHTPPQVPSMQIHPSVPALPPSEAMPLAC